MLEKLPPYKLLCIFLFCFSPVAVKGQYPLFKNITVADGLPSTRIFDITCDKKGNLWLATDKGAVVYNYKKFVTVLNTGQQWDNDIIRMYCDNAGKIWFCSSSGKIFQYNGDKAVQYPLGDDSYKKIANKIINQIAVDPSANLWISTVINGGLNLSQKYGKSLSFFSEPGNGFSYYVKEISKNQFIWGSAGRETVNNKLKVHFDTHSLDITLSSTGSGYTRSSFIRLMDGTYIFAKGHEMVNFSENVVISRAFVEKSIECLFEDSEGKIWAGLYGGGVICYPAGNLSNSSLISYLGEKTVTGICGDNAGNLWFSTLEDGLFKFAATTVASYTPPKIFSSKKNPASGKLPKVVSDTSKGNLGIVADVSEVKLRLVEPHFEDTIPPPVFMTGIKIHNKDTSLHNSYILDHKQNFIKFLYAGLSSDKNKNLQYKYMLEGVDQDWVYTNNTQAQYTTLPPGDYTFTVSAMNNKGIWSEKPAKTKILIRPPFWETWWARSSLGAAFSASVFLMFFVRDRKTKKKEREKALISKKINNLELQALRAQMNPHFIYNTLSSIQHFIIENNSDSALKYLTKFAKLMRRIMDNSSRPLISLQDELQALELYLELESARCNGKFKYEIIISPGIDLDYEQIPSMLIQPYIENAIWHGLMLKDEGGNLIVKIERKGHFLICTINDDGIGREKSAELKKSKHKSMGMSITKERLEILNSLHNSKLNVEITDLKSPLGEAMGTNVKIFIPSLEA